MLESSFEQCKKCLDISGIKILKVALFTVAVMEERPLEK